VQRTLAAKCDNISRRVFHAKSHGALLGELRLKSRWIRSNGLSCKPVE
jgi:hypothetical protein